MKKILALITLLILHCSFAFAGTAVESFETGWTEDISGSVVFDPAGTTLHASNSGGSGTYSKNFSDDFGAIATFNVSAATVIPNRDCSLGIGRYVANTLAGKKIRARLYLFLEYGTINTYSIQYQIDSTVSGVVSEVLARGFIGQGFASWTTGENIKLGIGYKNNKIYLFCDKNPYQYQIIDLFDTVSETDSATDIFINAGSASSISGLVSNLSVWTESTYIPHVTSNASWTDSLIVNNNSAFNSSYIVTLYDADGTQAYSAVHYINAHSEAVLLPKSLSASARCGNIISTNKDLFFRYSYQHDSGGVAEFELKSGFRNIYTQAGFYFNSTASLVDWKGMAIANFAGTTTNITLYAYSDSGLLGTTTDTIPGNGKIKGAHTKWFPAVSIGDLRKIIVVASNNLSSLGGVVICGNSANSSLLFTNAQDASGFVVPAP